MGLAYTEAFGRSVVAAESHSKTKKKQKKKPARYMEISLVCLPQFELLLLEAECTQ